MFNFSLRKLFVFILLGLSVLSLTVVVMGQSVFGQPELVDDIRVGAGGSKPIDLTALDGVLYFRANDGVLGEDFWVFDPASGSDPMLMNDGIPAYGGSFVPNFTVMNGDLYFRANDGVHGYEIWRYDPRSGNSAEMVADIVTGSGSVNPGELMAMDGGFVFLCE